MWIPDEATRLLPSTIARLTELVRKGGVLVASAPKHPATRLQGEQLAAFRQAVAELWHGDAGKGQVLDGVTIEEALRQLNLQADVRPTPVQWLHRQADGADWYMVCSPQENNFAGTVDFHASGRAELWNPMNGRVQPLNSVERDGYSSVNLSLERGECKYVVFRHDGRKQKVHSVQSTFIPQNSLKWTLTFPQGWGIDAPLTISQLQPWYELPLTDEGKAFSGTATYETVVTLDKRESKAQYILHLGKVEEIAVVKMNGEVVDTLWAAPYSADVTPYMKRGANHLTVEVTSTWRNRLVYDAGKPEAERKTWVLAGPAAGSQLKPYGLLGPVAVEKRKRCK